MPDEVRPRSDATARGSLDPGCWHQLRRAPNAKCTLRAFVLVASLLVLLGSLGCAAEGQPQELEADLTLRAIAVRDANVQPGAVRFMARNVDKGRHELVVLRTDRPPDALPVRASRVVTAARGIHTVDKIEPFDGPGTRSMTAELQAGPYVLICNLAGHYMLGMRTGLTVR